MSTAQPIKQESTYLSDGIHQLHIKHIWCQTQGIPVLMLHGTIENGRIFYTDSGKGLACYLAQQGFDVYVADFRGRGSSMPAIKDNQSHGQHELITRDIPLLIGHVASLTQQKLHVICHSWGGVLLASAQVRFPALMENIASTISIGTKRSIGKTSVEKLIKVDLIWNFLLPKLAKQRGYIDAKQLKIGADCETHEFLTQCVSWVKPSKWHDPVDSYNYAQAANGFNWPPTWHITGVNDSILGYARDVTTFIKESNPAAQFTLLSKAAGYDVDYDHINILTHPLAVDDYFPDLVSWIHCYNT